MDTILKGAKNNVRDNGNNFIVLFVDVVLGIFFKVREQRP